MSSIHQLFANRETAAEAMIQVCAASRILRIHPAGSVTTSRHIDIKVLNDCDSVCIADASGTE
jgi:hypothetical protein